MAASSSTDNDFLTAVRFVDDHNAALIQRVTTVMPIADELKGLITGELYSKIMAATIHQEKMRLLYNGLEAGGPDVKFAFYRSLNKHYPNLVQDLGKQDLGSSVSGTKSNQENKLIKYDSSRILGCGADGTIVYKGTFGDRDVAVKRIQERHFKQQEVQHLIALDSHNNVVQYYHTESDGNYQNIAIKLCDMSLEKYVKEKKKCDLQFVDILKQIMDGLVYLHFHSTVHGDVKPSNIMLHFRDPPEARVKIADFGLAKKLEEDRQSYSGNEGTPIWSAPEVLNKPTYAVDIFSAGCVFYYVLTRGHHPIVNNHFQMTLEMLQEDQCEDIMAKHLIEHMLSMEPKKRPSAETVLYHPFFWSSEKQLNFIEKVSDWTVTVKKNDPIIQELERGRQKVFNQDWMEQITDEKLQKNLKEGKVKYDNSSVKDLLRAIRNQKHHYRENGLEMILGSSPDEFVKYFTSRFPHLLLHTYLTMRTFAEEKTFQDYYPKSKEAWMITENSVTS